VSLGLLLLQVVLDASPSAEGHGRGCRHAPPGRGACIFRSWAPGPSAKIPLRRY